VSLRGAGVRAPPSGRTTAKLVGRLGAGQQQPHAEQDRDDRAEQEDEVCGRDEVPARRVQVVQPLAQRRLSSGLSQNNIRRLSVAQRSRWLAISAAVLGAVPTLTGNATYAERQPRGCSS